MEKKQVLLVKKAVFVVLALVVAFFLFIFFEAFFEDTQTGVGAEYDYFRDNACLDKGGFKEVTTQALMQDDEGNSYDLVEVVCYNGETETYRFDVYLG